MKTLTTINGFPIVLIRRHGVWYACTEGLKRPGRTRREAIDSLRHEWNRGIVGESLAWKALCRAIDRGKRPGVYRSVRDLVRAMFSVPSH